MPLVPNPLYAASKAGLHMFTLSLRRQLAETPVRVIEIFPPALDTGLALDMEVPGARENGPRVIDEVARLSVEGILAGQPTILPHPQSVELVEAIGGNVEAVADRVNAALARREGWDQAG
jgi:NAD(P)-dependent dehydrogenase (short-subunit alcohol dehydrogenase family)